MGPLRREVQMRCTILQLSAGLAVLAFLLGVSGPASAVTTAEDGIIGDDLVLYTKHSQFTDISVISLARHRVRAERLTDHQVGLSSDSGW